MLEPIDGNSITFIVNAFYIPVMYRHFTCLPHRPYAVDALVEDPLPRIHPSLTLSLSRFLPYTTTTLPFSLLYISQPIVLA